MFNENPRFSRKYGGVVRVVAPRHSVALPTFALRFRKPFRIPSDLFMGWFSTSLTIPVLRTPFHSEKYTNRNTASKHSANDHLTDPIRSSPSARCCSRTLRLRTTTRPRDTVKTTRAGGLPVPSDAFTGHEVFRKKKKNGFATFIMNLNWYWEKNHYLKTLKMKIKIYFVISILPNISALLRRKYKSYL